MKKLLLFVFCILTLQAFSQDDIIYLKGSKVDEWFNQTRAEMKRKELSKSEVVNAQAQDIPTNMMEILIQHDWVRIGKIFFKDGGYDKASEKSLRSIDFERYTQNGIQYGLRCYKRASEQSYFVDYNSGKNPKISIIKANGKNFLKYDYANVNGEPISYGQLISYKNGVLIYDLTRDGTIYATNSLSRYRIVLMAVPRINIGNTLKGVNSPYLNPNENPNPNYGNNNTSNNANISISSTSSNLDVPDGDCNPISNNQFQEAYNTIKQEIFPEERLIKAKEMLKKYQCFSVNQIGQIMEFFPFSEARMSFLESAYPYTSDKHNFGMLASKLTFDKDKKKLKDIIQKAGK